MKTEPHPQGGRPVSCHGCRHLVSTWNPNFPYGCRLIGMQSRVLPSIEVRRETGEECAGYERRVDRAGA